MSVSERVGVGDVLADQARGEAGGFDARERIARAEIVSQAPASSESPRLVVRQCGQVGILAERAKSLAVPGRVHHSEQPAFVP